MFGRPKEKTGKGPPIKSHPSSKGKTAPTHTVKEPAIDQEHLQKAATTLCRFVMNIESQLHRQEKLMSEAITAHNEDITGIKTCFDIAADCQKKTSELANQGLERHALHPCVLALETLIGLIDQMASQAGALMKNHKLDDATTPLAHSIIDAARMAKSKKQQLQLQTIQPVEMDDLDSNRHTIVKAVTTDDASKHKKIQKTIVAGLIYHGKVLRQAKVIVYSYCGEEAAEKK